MDRRHVGGVSASIRSQLRTVRLENNPKAVAVLTKYTSGVRGVVEVSTADIPRRGYAVVRERQLGSGRLKDHQFQIAPVAVVLSVKRQCDSTRMK